LQHLLALVPFEPPDPITARKALLALPQYQLVLSGDDRRYLQRQHNRSTASQHPEQVGLQ
jgi:hypothetical protein